jgi:hypothetical protein
MYPQQMLDLTPELNAEITTFSTEIIQAAHMIVSQQLFDLRFIVFPLFIAGFATQDPNEKDLALRLLRTVERYCCGVSTESARRLLEMIYNKQAAAAHSPGGSGRIDWVEEMGLSGQRLIIYGL